MKCPICKNELEIKSKKVSESANGESIFNEFAICHDCKKQWNLDKQRAKKAAPAPAPVEKPVAEVKQAAVEKPANDAEARPKKRKKRPVENTVDGATKVLDKLPSAENSEITMISKSPEMKELKIDDVPAPAEKPEAPVERPRKKKRPVNPDAVKNAASAEEVKPVVKEAVAEEAVTEERPRPKKKRRPAPEAAPVSVKSEAIKPEKAEVPAERPRKKKRPANPDAVRKAASAEEVKPVVKEAVAEEAVTEERPRPKKKRRPAPEAAEGAVKADRPVKKKKPAPVKEESIDDILVGLDDLSDEEPKKRPKKRKPIDNRAKEEPTFSNIPPKSVREEREKEMRQNYQMMLDEDDEEDEGGFPTILIVILILLILAAAAFAGYWFFLR